jgi:rod shape-determining protein MreC
MIDLGDIPGGSDVRVGDKVITSGLGTVYGRGVPIGKVTAVHVDNARYLVSASVKTDVDFDHLQEVFLEP